jgi:hypothetical protein
MWWYRNIPVLVTGSGGMPSSHSHLAKRHEGYPSRGFRKLCPTTESEVDEEVHNEGCNDCEAEEQRLLTGKICLCCHHKHKEGD